MITILVGQALAADDPLELAAAWEDSAYFGWATELASNLGERRAIVQPSSGSVANLDLLADGLADMALMQSDIAWHAAKGVRLDPAEVVAIGRAYQEVVHVVVPKDSSLQTAAELTGPVDVGRVGSGSLFNALDVVGQLANEVEPVYGGGFLPGRMSKGRLCSEIYTTRAPHSLLDKAKGLRVIPLGSLVEPLSVAPYYTVVDNPYGSGQTVAVEALLVARPDIAAADVVRILETGMLDTQGVSIPLHPAARDWFAAKGQPTSEALPDYTPTPLPLLPPRTPRVAKDKAVRFLTAEEVVRMALERHFSVGVAVLQAAQEATSLDAASARRRPELGGSGGADDKGFAQGMGVTASTWTGTTVGVDIINSSSGIDSEATWGSRAELSVRQQILDGMFLDQTQADIRRARVDAEIASLERIESALDLVQRVERRFYDLSEAQARVRVFARRVNLARQHLNRVQLRSEVDGNELAVHEAGAAMARAEELLLEEQRKLRDIEDQLLDDIDARFAWRLVPVGGVETLAEQAGDAGDVDPAIERALANRPDLAQIDLTIRKAEIDVAEARWQRLPGFGIRGGVGVATDGTDANITSGMAALTSEGQPVWSLGGSASIPLGRQPEAFRMNRARLVAKQRELEKIDATEGVARTVRGAFRALENADKRLEVAQRRRDLADRKLALALEAFREDPTDSLKVLAYQDDYLDARLRVLEAATDLLQARAALVRETGEGLVPYSAEFDARLKQEGDAVREALRP